MSGVKRRSRYRKTTTAGVTDSLPEPAEGQSIARIVKNHGSNLLEVVTAAGVEGKAILPTKYRKLIWVKRGDYVILDESTGEIDTARGEAGAVRYMVVNILFAPQVKHLRAAGKWPAAFDAPVACEAGGVGAASEGAEDGAGAGGGGGAGGGDEGADAVGTGGGGEEEEEDTGSSPSDDDCDLFVNTNRRVAAPADDTESSEEEDEDEADADAAAAAAGGEARR